MDLIERICNVAILASVKYTFTDKINVISINDKPLADKLWLWEKSAGKDVVVSITTIAALKCWLENGKNPTVIACDKPFPYKTCVFCEGDAIHTLLCKIDYPDHIAFLVLQKDIDIISAQDPANIDKLYKTQKEIESIRIIMHEAIDKVLIRGERIEDLQDRSKILGETSAKFFDRSKELNRCCGIL
jgi:hypothetical protein